MTVRTRKTITDLIQQLKAQEKEIKAQLSDSQRRLNETRDRISTLYWVIEEVADIGTDEVIEENYPCGDEDDYRLSPEEYQMWKEENPHLTEEQLESVITRNGWLLPLSTISYPKEITKEEWEELVRNYPNLSGGELATILESQGFTTPALYEGCPCPDCSKDRERTKSKPKAKPLPKKKPTKKITKKGKK